MANYASLTAALAAGVDNMTVLRNNVKNDDATSIYNIDIDWFYFNGVQVTKLYSNGNSWMGFGASSEQLRVNRRDAAVWYEYIETGTISGKKFLKFTWKGYSRYNQTSASYQQCWDVFLFDTGQLFLNFWQVPESDVSGTNSLTCGSQTVTYAVTAGTPCEYTFTPENIAEGKTWAVTPGQPAFAEYVPSGYAEYAITAIRAMSEVSSAVLSWAEDGTEDTSVTVLAKLDAGAYAPVTSGAQLPVTWPSDLSGSTLYIKIQMSTSDTSASPALSGMMLEAFDAGSRLNLLLLFASGTVGSFRNAAGNITLTYDGAGGLEGEGGPVEDFTETFTPVGLTPKPNQSDAEHIEFGLTAVGALTRIYYTDAQEREHISLAVSASGVLTHVDDL